MDPETETHYEQMTEIIRSGQMEHMEVIQYLKDNPEFAHWYVANKLGDAFSNGNAD